MKSVWQWDDSACINRQQIRRVTAFLHQLSQVAMQKLSHFT